MSMPMIYSLVEILLIIGDPGVHNAALFHSLILIMALFSESFIHMYLLTIPFT